MFSIITSRFVIPSIRKSLIILNKELIRSDNNVRLVQSALRTYATKKKVYKRNKPHCNIGTIGHVDHGKTTLTAAITKVLAQENLAKAKKYADIDSAPEEITRGMTINLAYVEYETNERHYAHIDCPGCALYVKNMIAGAFQIDGGILVVAANDGIMPQTRQHLMLAKQIGIKHIVIFINKIDAVDDKTVELVEMDMRELMTEMEYDGDNVPVVAGSALFALQDKDPKIGFEPILKLLREIDCHIPTPKRDLDSGFLLPVDKVYSVKGRGTIVTGRLEKGIVKKKSPCKIVGFSKRITDTKSVVTDIEIFHKVSEEGHAGDQLGLLLRGVKRKSVERGMIVCKSGTVNFQDHVEAQVYVLTKKECEHARPFTTLMKFQMFAQSWNCQCQITVPDEKMAMPGKDSKLILKMIKPVFLKQGQRFILRDGTVTRGIGVITKVLKSLSEQERLTVQEGRKPRERRLLKEKPVKK